LSCDHSPCIELQMFLFQATAMLEKNLTENYSIVMQSLNIWPASNDCRQNGSNTWKDSYWQLFNSRVILDHLTSFRCFSSKRFKYLHLHLLRIIQLSCDHSSCIQLQRFLAQMAQMLEKPLSENYSIVMGSLKISPVSNVSRPTAWDTSKDSYSE
jgi:hypothetical protein